MKKFLYFQPEYVSNFKCDGSKCNARCCKNWRIDIDEKSIEQYASIEPPEISKEILSCMEFDSERETYTMTLKPNGFCPMLTEKNLCRLQADYGENFLSQTCATYPRKTFVFGNFFERALNLSCPVAAEMILFAKEPIKFFFVNVDEKVHSNGGKIFANPFSTKKLLAEELFSIQVTMISILQERRLSINQRLIVLGFFVDALEELMSVKISSQEESLNLVRAVKKLTASYNPRVFLQEIIPPVIQNVSFDAEKFIMFMVSVFEPIYTDAVKNQIFAQKYFDAIIDLLQIERRATFKESAEKYMTLAEERKEFLSVYSVFLENFIVNEFFINLYPWKFDGGLVKNFAVFVTTCKVFELIIFSAWLKGFADKNDLLNMVDWFARKIDHNDECQKKTLELLKYNGDVLELMNGLLES